MVYSLIEHTKYMVYFQQISGKREIEHNLEGSAGISTEPLRVPGGRKD